MRKIKLSVGTTSDQKIGYLKEILEEIGIDAEISAVEVASGISDQPMTSEETMLGSINRAKEALNKNSKADFSIGIEVGYHPNKDNKYEIFCWATIVDNKKIIISKKSHRFLLPEFHQKILNKNLYLGDYVKEYFKKGDDSVTQYVAEIIRGRKPFIKIAIKNALIFYLKREEF